MEEVSSLMIDSSVDTKSRELLGRVTIKLAVFFDEVVCSPMFAKLGVRLIDLPMVLKDKTPGEGAGNRKHMYML